MSAATLLPSRPDRDARELAAAHGLFDALRAAGLRYCHWKSNEHLVPALRGETDLDVLVDRSGPVPVERILDARGLKRIAVAPERHYPGVDDYLAFDWDTGRLAHLHLHHRLVLGERYLKGYSLRWEELLLETRRVDEATGVYVSDPSVELLLLLVRSALKLRHRDRLPWRLGGPALRGDTLVEYRWLLERADSATVATIAAERLGTDAARRVTAMLHAVPSVRALQAFARAAAPALAAHRTYRPAAALRLRWWREWRSRWRSRLNRALQRQVPVRHTLPHGGIVIALLGSDGSGKSTLAAELRGWLGWKLDVTRVYFGSGDGPSSLLRAPLRRILAWRAGRVRASGARPAAAAGPVNRETPGAARGRLRAAWWACWSLALALEKRDRLAQARRARNLGMVVVCDRYPQAQIHGFTDGPRLAGWLDHRSRLLRALARWEVEAYRAADASPPDLVLKLGVTPEVAAARKPDMDHDDLVRRIRAVRDLRFPPETRVVEVDVTQPLDRVLLEVKRAVWASL